jgi:hypothetical protein
MLAPLPILYSSINSVAHQVCYSVQVLQNWLRFTNPISLGFVQICDARFHAVPFGFTEDQTVEPKIYFVM